jgi:hypothetical protein
VRIEAVLGGRREGTTMIDESAESSLALMRVKLDDFGAGRLDLRSVISDLEGLISALEGKLEPSTIENLRSAWWRLEFINATAIDHKRDLAAREQEEVRAATRQLQELIDHSKPGEGSLP